MNKTWFIAGLSLALVVMAGRASLALEEQKSNITPNAAAAAAAETAPAAKKSDEGTEIRIPGLGKLGTLPKMDFGLELLYGATETGKAPEPSGIEDTNEDLTIRGSVKHRF